MAKDLMYLLQRVALTIWIEDHLSALSSMAPERMTLANVIVSSR